MAAGPVSHSRVRLGLQRAQVSDQRRGQVLPSPSQGRLGILDDLPVQTQVQGLVRQQGDDVSAEAPVAGSLTARIRSTVELDGAGQILERLCQGGFRRCRYAWPSRSRC